MRTLAQVCGAVDPERPGVAGDDGEWLVDPVTCTAHMKDKNGTVVGHRGKHRSRVLRGIVHRWSDAEGRTSFKYTRASKSVTR